jgi:hypothetical protein
MIIFTDSVLHCLLFVSYIFEKISYIHTKWDFFSQKDSYPFWKSWMLLTIQLATYNLTSSHPDNNHFFVSNKKEVQTIKRVSAIFLKDFAF